jgi:hypothetical protein
MLTITVPEHIDSVAIDFESEKFVREIIVNRHGQIIGESNRSLEAASLPSLVCDDVPVNVAG